MIQATADTCNTEPPVYYLNNIRTNCMHRNKHSVHKTFVTDHCYIFK